MANTSIYNDIYTCLNANATLTALCGLIAWDGLPNSRIETTRIIYRMIDDVRVHDSHIRNQRWRFWICVPFTEATPKVKCLNIANVMLDTLHEQGGAVGSVTANNIECVSNQDPVFDETLNCYMIIQDYIFKMKTLQ